MTFFDYLRFSKELYFAIIYLLKMCELAIVFVYRCDLTPLDQKIDRNHRDTHVKSYFWKFSVIQNIIFTDACFRNTETRPPTCPVLGRRLTLVGPKILDWITCALWLDIDNKWIINHWFPSDNFIFSPVLSMHSSCVYRKLRCLYIPTSSKSKHFLRPTIMIWVE